MTEHSAESLREGKQRDLKRERESWVVKVEEREGWSCSHTKMNRGREFGNFGSI